MSFSGNKQSHLLKQEISLKFINSFIESVTNYLPYGIYIYDIEDSYEGRKVYK